MDPDSLVSCMFKRLKAYNCPAAFFARPITRYSWLRRTPRPSVSPCGLGCRNLAKWPIFVFPVLGPSNGCE
jgi:hypothetical protein